MSIGELDNAKLELALAGSDDRKLAEWARRFGEELIREIEDREIEPEDF